MRLPHEFIGHHVLRSNGRMWSCRTCNAPYVVVDRSKSIKATDTYLRGLCSVCLAESIIKHTEGQMPVNAAWHIKLAMTRSDRWPAWASKGVFDSE